MAPSGATLMAEIIRQGGLPSAVRTTPTSGCGRRSTGPVSRRCCQVQTQKIAVSRARRSGRDSGTTPRGEAKGRPTRCRKAARETTAASCTASCRLRLRSGRQSGRALLTALTSGIGRMPAEVGHGLRVRLGRSAVKLQGPARLQGRSGGRVGAAARQSSRRLITNAAVYGGRSLITL